MSIPLSGTPKFNILLVDLERNEETIPLLSEHAQSPECVTVYGMYLTQ